MNNNPRGRLRRQYLLYCSWSYKVTTIEIKHMDLDKSLVRAVAKQAEAKRNSTIVSQKKRRRCI